MTGDSGPEFIELSDIVIMHSEQISLYGGQTGIRNMGLLISAGKMPTASLAGEWLHRDVYEMAAAYAFHISQNQPFYDGNKRTGLVSALAFLEINRISPQASHQVLIDAVFKLASGKLSKNELAGIFRSLPLESDP